LDIPAGDAPEEEKRMLEERYCDPAVREPFIAALAMRDSMGAQMWSGLLDGIPGAYAAAQLGLKQVKEGKTIPLGDL
jgi:hypothetical protein